MPSVLTITGKPNIIVERNQGNPRPRRTSKTLEPITLATAISPFPSRATRREHNATGRLDPTARTVLPITFADTPMHLPVLSAKSTIKNEIAPIQRTEIVNV
eukprot:759194_1